MVRPNPSGDLGLEVKSLTKRVIAGSFRNAPQRSSAGGRWQGRDTDWMVKDRKVQPSCQTQNLPPPKKAGVSAAG